MTFIDYARLNQVLNPTVGAPGAAHLRTGVVDAVNVDGTLDVAMGSGIVIPGVSRLSSAVVNVGDNVVALTYNGLIVVLGKVATS